MRTIFLFIGILTSFLNAWAGENKKFVRKGNRQYENKNYAEAEISYRKAIEENSNTGASTYNLGNALYRQNKHEEAAAEYNRAADANLSKTDQAKVYHNLGNALLQTQKYKESIEAYKKALRLNPRDMETKYNLSFAQKKLKENPQQDQKNQQNQQNKDDNKDKQNDKQDKQNNDQQKQDQQQQDQQQQKQNDNNMSKNDAERILQAIQDDEKNTHDKLDKEKAAAKKVKPDVDW